MSIFDMVGHLSGWPFLCLRIVRISLAHQDRSIILQTSSDCTLHERFLFSPALS